MTDTDSTATPAADAAIETTGADQANPATDAAPDSTEALLTGKDADDGPLLTGQDGAGDDAKADGEKEKAKEGAPEKYGDFTFPEGMPINQERLDKATAVFREIGLSQEQAQKLIDLETAATGEFQEAQKAALAQQLAQYRQDARTDPEIGGADHKAKMAIANKALSKFGSPELIKALSESGWSSHPEMARLLYRIGKSTTDDGVFLPSNSNRRRSAAETLYGTDDTHN